MKIRGFNQAQSEQGSALAAAVGVMAVMSALSIVILTVTVSSLGYTSGSRAGIQSVMAAESGVNVAEVAFRQDTCAASYAQAAEPAYSATVSYSLSLTNNVWVAGCPAAGVAAVRLRIISTGIADATGVSGNTSGDESVVEAIYEIDRIPGVFPSGSAMYMHGGVVFENNADLLVSQGGIAAIQVKQGNVTCGNNTVIQGDVIVRAGNLSIISCTISGNAWVSGSATLGDITGNLSAASVNQVSSVAGVFTQGGAVPTVANWSDIAYVPGDWVHSDLTPYKVTTTSSSNCTVNAALLATASDGTKPVILDMRACALPGIRTATNTTVNLTNDVVIFAHGFDFQYGVDWKSSSTAEHNLWFITPDNTVDALPTCAAGQGDFLLKNNFTIDPKLAVLLYTPCEMDTKNNFTWRGQIYANGPNTFKNNTWFEFEALGIAGRDLNTGLPPTGGAIGTTGELGDQLSIRDVTG